MGLGTIRPSSYARAERLGAATAGRSYEHGLPPPTAPLPSARMNGSDQDWLPAHTPSNSQIREILFNTHIHKGAHVRANTRVACPDVSHGARKMPMASCRVEAVLVTAAMLTEPDTSGRRRTAAPPSVAAAGSRKPASSSIRGTGAHRRIAPPRSRALAPCSSTGSAAC
jgi:hypothetical protein